MTGMHSVECNCSLTRELLDYVDVAPIWQTFCQVKSFLIVNTILKYKFNYYLSYIHKGINYNILTRIEGVMVSVIASSVVDTGFKIRSGQTKRLKDWYLLLLRESRSIK